MTVSLDPFHEIIAINGVLSRYLYFVFSLVPNEVRSGDAGKDAPNQGKLPCSPDTKHFDDPAPWSNPGPNVVAIGGDGSFFTYWWLTAARYTYQSGHRPTSIGTSVYRKRGNTWQGSAGVSTVLQGFPETIPDIAVTEKTVSVNQTKPSVGFDSEIYNRLTTSEWNQSAGTSPAEGQPGQPLPLPYSGAGSWSASPEAEIKLKGFSISPATEQCLGSVGSGFKAWTGNRNDPRAEIGQYNFNFGDIKIRRKEQIYVPISTSVQPGSKTVVYVLCEREDLI